MGKRSDFETRQLAFYPTPREAVAPLTAHLPDNVTFCEPCAGAGDLVKHLEHYKHKCTIAYDVAPRQEWILAGDAVWLQKPDLCGADFIITNPPWERVVLHQIIERCSKLAPPWLLFDVDWMHTRQATPYLKLCKSIVSIGRVKWIENTKNSGMDNCCWYLFFDPPPEKGIARFPTAPRFHGRQ